MREVSVKERFPHAGDDRKHLKVLIPETEQERQMVRLALLGAGAVRDAVPVVGVPDADPDGSARTYSIRLGDSRLIWPDADGWYPGVVDLDVVPFDAANLFDHSYVIRFALVWDANTFGTHGQRGRMRVMWALEATPYTQNAPQGPYFLDWEGPTLYHPQAAEASA